MYRIEVYSVTDWDWYLVDVKRCPSAIAAAKTAEHERALGRAVRVKPALPLDARREARATRR